MPACSAVVELKGYLLYMYSNSLFQWDRRLKEGFRSIIEG
jgi:hypothetical protein